MSQRIRTKKPSQGVYCSGTDVTQDGQPDLILKSYHVSCQSDRPKSYQNPGKNYGGLVLYQYDGKSKWELNNVHCRTGYVILKDSSKLPHSKLGQVHGAVYKSVFGSCDGKVVASGFAYNTNHWGFTSGTFNLACNEYTMTQSEITYLKKALEKWCDDGTQNTYIEPPLNIYIKNK